MLLSSLSGPLQAFYGAQNGTNNPPDAALYWGNSSTEARSGNVTTESCQLLSSNLNLLTLGTLCMTAIIFLTLMSAFEKRSSFKLHWFDGRPGPVIPFNLVDGYENRFAYALAFGITTSYCISILFANAQSVLGQRIAAVISASPPYVRVFFKIIATIIIATGAYPLFVCIGTRYKRHGSFFGLIYSILWFSLFCYKTSEVFKICKDLPEYDLIAEFPQYISLLLLMLLFLRRIVISFKQPSFFHGLEEATSRKNKSHLYQHVRSLLQRRKYDSMQTFNESKGCIKNIIAKLKHAMYKPRQEFKYSSRIVCTIVVCFFAIYMICIGFVVFAIWVFDKLIPLLHSPEFNTIIGKLFGSQYLDKIQTLIKIWRSCFLLAIIFSTIKTWIVFLNMLAWYRNHLTRLRQGDRKWLPKSMWTFNGSLSSLTAASMKFGGYQVAYAAWGYIIFVIVLWIIFGLMVSFIVYPIAMGELSFLLDNLYKIWPAIAIPTGIYLAQWLTAKYCFLMKNGKFFAIDNRKAFNIVTYYLFFFNIFIGLFSCLLRIVMSLIFGVVFLERVQKSVLPSSFEVFDPGYYAYIGYILIEHVHSNPVLKVFIYLLNENLDNKRTICSNPGAILLVNADEPEHAATRPDLAERFRRFKIVRNRWNVAYTLIKNPDLVKLRKKHRKDDCGENSSTETSFIMITTYK